MEKLFNTVYTTSRHRELGYCEPSDFGAIELIRLSPDEKELAVSFKDYGYKYHGEDKGISLQQREFIVYGKDIYVKMDAEHMQLLQSREEDTVFLKKFQGKLSDKTAKKVMLELRDSARTNFSYATNYKFIIIGNTLYEHYCEIKDFDITVSGNLGISCWVSINIEAHGGNKVHHKLSRSKYEKVFAETKKEFEEAKAQAHERWGDKLPDKLHVSFSYPSQSNGVRALTNKL